MKTPSYLTQSSEPSERGKTQRRLTWVTYDGLATYLQLPPQKWRISSHCFHYCI